MKPIGNLTWQRFYLLTFFLVLGWGGGFGSCQGQVIPSVDSTAVNKVPTQADSLMVFLSRRGMQEQRDIHITFKRVHVLTRRRKRWRLKRNRKVRVFEGRIEKMRHAWLPMWRHKDLVLKGEGIKGHFLAPGLIDMHAHVGCDLYGRLGMLRYGVTTVRDFSDRGGSRKERELINKRCLVSPLLFSAWSGNILRRTDIVDHQLHGVDFYFSDKESRSVNTFNLDLAISLGLDIAWQGSQLEDWSKFRMSRYFRTLEGLDSYLPTNWPKDKKVAGNQKLTANTDGIWIVPCLVSTLGPFSPSKYYETFYEGGYPLLSTVNVGEWRNFIMPNVVGNGIIRMMNLENMELYHKSRMSITRKLIQNGSSILVGTETGTGTPFVVPGYSFHEEMKTLNSAGMSITEVLDAATLEAAKALRAEKDIGQIKRRMKANMVLLKKNPIKNLDHYLTIEGVMVNGFWLGDQEMKWIKRSLNEVEPIKGRSLK